MSREGNVTEGLKKESKRIKAFREELVKRIKHHPADKVTKDEMLAMPLPDLLACYINWVSRFVKKNPRSIVVLPSVEKDPQWTEQKEGIDTLLQKVRLGEDLTQSLSLQAHKYGYVSPNSSANPDGLIWTEDKDFLLNTMGFYHFHLGTTVVNNHVDRTNYVLFAHVTNDLFTVVAIANHDVFESDTEEMNSERTQLWETFENYSKHPGLTHEENSIMMNGFNSKTTRKAINCAKLIASTDPDLEKYDFLKKLYAAAGQHMPKKCKFKWEFNFLDLGVLEKREQVFFPFLKH